MTSILARLVKTSLFLRPRILAGGIAAALLAPAPQAVAAQLSWDGSNVLNVQADGGTGTWNSNSTANWWNGAADVVWPDTGTDNDALFSGANGAVTIGAGGVTVNDVRFSTSGYILSGTNTITLNGSTPTITVDAAVTATIGANTATVLAGTAGLTKAGNGSLTLNGSAVHTFTGGLSVTGGTLTLDNTNLATPTNLINAGNTLTLSAATLRSVGKTTATGQTFAGALVTSGTSVIRITRGGSTTNTIQLGAATHQPGGTLTFVQETGVASEVLKVTNVTSGKFLGTWAFYGDPTTSTGARWANINSQSFTTVQGTNAGTNMANVSDGTLIYTVNGVTTPGASKTALGLQSSTGATYAMQGNTLTTNGLLMIDPAFTLLVTGTAGIVIGSGANGSDYELVAAGPGAITISAPIADNPGHASHVTYAGGSTLTLQTAASTYTGLTTVNSGTVALGLANVLHSSSGIVVNAGTLSYAGNNQSVNSVSLRGGTISGTTGALTSATDFDLRNGTVSGILAGGVGVTKTTTGTVTLSGANLYTGATNVNAGQLNVTGSLTSAITVNSGTTLGGEGSTTGALTFTGATSFSFDPSTIGAFLAGSINAAGGTVTLVPTVPASGTGIVVMESSTPITGTPGVNFVFVGRGSTHFNGTQTQLLFDYTPGTVSWRGNDSLNPTFWDSGVTKNWLNGATVDYSYNGDAVTFDDDGVSTTVNIQGSGVQPGLVTFNNTLKAYTVQGASIGGNATIVKNGTNTVILAGANTYSGTTTINAGAIQLGDGTNPNGSFGAGAVTNHGSIITNFGGNNATIAQTIDGEGTLTQNGTGVVTLTANNTYTGQTFINGGTLQIGAGTSGTIGAGAVTVAAGAKLGYGRTETTPVQNFANAITGDGGFAKSGGSTIILGTSNN